MMMTMGLKLSCAAALMAAALGLAPLHAAEPITGRWVTADKDAVIVIGKCGTALCGSIAKFLNPQPGGDDQRDVKNPDPVKRKRRLIGTAILTDFTQEADLWRGQIYDPNSGKTYRSVIRRKGSNGLEVKGCIGPFCQTQMWKRAG